MSSRLVRSESSRLRFINPSSGSQKRHQLKPEFECFTCESPDLTMGSVDLQVIRCPNEAFRPEALTCYLLGTLNPLKPLLNGTKQS